MRGLNLQSSKVSLVIVMALAGFTALVLETIYPSRSMEMRETDGGGLEAHAPREARQVLPGAAAEAGGRAVPNYTPQPPQPLPTPGSWGKAAGEVVPVVLDKRGLEASLLAQPMPKMWLIFESHALPEKLPGIMQEEKPEVSVQLPERAKRELRSLWRSACYYYYLELKRPKDVESRKRRDRVLTVIKSNASVRLESLNIKAPSGIRKIDMKESHDLVHLLCELAEATLRHASETIEHRKPVI